MFTPIIETESVVDKCTNALQEAIISGSIEPGEKLPTERALAAQFGVNRVTIRGALGRLHAAGLVTVRQGSGYRVLDYRITGGMSLLGSILAQTTDPEELEAAIGDLLVIRRTMACAVLSRLARGIHPDDLRRISKAIDAFAAAADAGADRAELFEAESELLRCLIDATRSPVLGLCLNPLLQSLSSQPSLIHAMMARPGESVVRWRLLEAWLAEPNSFPIQSILQQLERHDQHTLSRMRSRTQSHL